MSNTGESLNWSACNHTKIMDPELGRERERERCQKKMHCCVFVAVCSPVGLPAALCPPIASLLLSAVLYNLRPLWLPSLAQPVRCFFAFVASVCLRAMSYGVWLVVGLLLLLVIFACAPVLGCGILWMLACRASLARRSRGCRQPMITLCG